MAWKAKLKAVDEDGVHVQYYDNASNQTKTVTYGLDEFNNKPQLVNHITPILAQMNSKKGNVTALQAALANTIGEDIE